MKKKITGIILGGIFIVTSNAWAVVKPQPGVAPADPVAETALPKIEDVSTTAKVDKLGEALKAKSLALSGKTQVNNLLPNLNINNGIYSQEAVQKINTLINAMKASNLKEKSKKLSSHSEGLMLKDKLDNAVALKTPVYVLNGSTLEIKNKVTGEVVASYSKNDYETTYTNNKKTIKTNDGKYTYETTFTPKFVENAETSYIEIYDAETGEFTGITGTLNFNVDTGVFTLMVDDNAFAQMNVKSYYDEDGGFVRYVNPITNQVIDTSYAETSYDKDNLTKIYKDRYGNEVKTADLIVNTRPSMYQLLYVDPDSTYNVVVVRYYEVYLDTEKSQLCYVDLSTNKIAKTKDVTITENSDGTITAKQNRGLRDVVVFEGSKTDGYPNYFYNAETGKWDLYSFVDNQYIESKDATIYYCVDDQRVILRTPELGITVLDYKANITTSINGDATQITYLENGVPKATYDLEARLNKDKTQVIYCNTKYKEDVLTRDVVQKDDGYYDAVSGAKVADLGNSFSK